MSLRILKITEPMGGDIYRVLKSFEFGEEDGMFYLKEEMGSIFCVDAFFARYTDGHKVLSDNCEKIGYLDITHKYIGNGEDEPYELVEVERDAINVGDIFTGAIDSLSENFDDKMFVVVGCSGIMDGDTPEWCNVVYQNGHVGKWIKSRYILDECKAEGIQNIDYTIRINNDIRFM